MAKKALCSGINTYPAANHLNGCLNDARSWSEMLVGSYDFARSDVRLLVESEATKRGMLDAVDVLLASAKKGDVLVFTYSGHGTYVGDTSGDEPQYDEAMCPYNLQDGLLIDDELRERFQNLASGVRLTVVSDSCFSGTVTRVMLTESVPGIFTYTEQAKWRVRFLSPRLEWMPQRGDQVLDNPWPVTSKRSLTQASMNHLLLSGCTDKQYSYDAQFGGKAYGAMSYACLQAMKGIGTGITYSQLIREVNVKLKAWGFPQTPQLEGPSAWKRRRLFS